MVKNHNGEPKREHLLLLFLLQFLTPHSVVSRNTFSAMYLVLAAVFLVRQLIEMLADDKALEQVSRQTLLKAIVTVAAAAAPEAPGSAAAGSSNAQQVGMPGGEVSSRRLQRLLTPEEPLAKPQRGLVLACTVLLMVCPTVLLIAPRLLAW